MAGPDTSAVERRCWKIYEQADAAWRRSPDESAAEYEAMALMVQAANAGLLARLVQVEERRRR
ncbi:hypothetical protein ACFS2C_28060 [Prauserella oleivorans]|uniref:Uncharacterized protein n=1 Tax=Prauserella oleivorans TaxID=1478153 RepID=A0ABW5WHC2_9PSEU